MFFIALFAAVLLVATVCLAQAVLSRLRRVPPDLSPPLASPALLSAAMSPLLSPVLAVVSPRLPSVPEASSTMLLFQPMSPPPAALVAEIMSPPLPSEPLLEAMPPPPPPPPPPTVDDEFLGLFAQMNITPPAEQVHSLTTEMWHVPERPPPVTEEEREFGMRAFVRSLYLRARNRRYDRRGDPLRYAVATNFLQQHFG
ncbi:hypothetical protein BJV82DRAFT_668960 [Fennellomyces sp. T-0311]|nr:hypothetical protein BJV82DRAFT_668960 [Fennellomyces sp. T-0311]